MNLINVDLKVKIGHTMPRTRVLDGEPGGGKPAPTGSELVAWREMKEPSCSYTAQYTCEPGCGSPRMFLVIH